MTSQLFVNGKVFTGRSESDFVTGFRITDGLFSWVGDADDLVGAEKAGAVDLQSRTVLPGFLDVHTHPAFMANLLDTVSCLPPEVMSIAELIERLRTHPNLGREDGSWIEGFGYDESKYPEGRHPTAADLNQVSSTQPVFVHRCDGHSAVCNTRALQLAGITSATPDPNGAAYGRDANRQLTGVLTEIAASNSVHLAKPAPDADEQVRKLARLNQHFVSHGIVAIADLMATEVEAPLEMFRAAERAGLLPQCALYYSWTVLAAKPIADLTDEDRTGRIKFAGVKLFLDGAYSNRTAWTEDAYPDSDEHGMRTVSDDELTAAVAWARRNRVQVAIHAMGDRAINHVIDIFGEQPPWMGDLPSIRFEHATLFSSAMIDRMNAAQMSFAVVSHTIFLFAEYDNYQRNLTEEQFRIAYPIRSYYERVSFAALSSDNPTTAWADADNVFTSLQAAVLRQAYNGADIGQPEAISIAQGVLLYTGRALQLCPLDAVGLIEEGYEGSFVILDRDLFSVAALEIGQVQVAETWIQGSCAFRRQC